MKTRNSSLFAVFMICSLAVSVFGANDAQEKPTALHQAQINFDRAGKAPTMIQFDQAKQPTAASFFNEYKQYFGISHDNTIQSYRSTHDQLGTHHRYIQHYKGIPIIGAEYILHEKNGAVWHANGLLVHDLNLDVAPALTEQAALH
jgi:Zn-dependent metalloprotease